MAYLAYMTCMIGVCGEKADFSFLEDEEMSILMHTYLGLEGVAHPCLKRVSTDENTPNLEASSESSKELDRISHS
jgi:hypothetical protein